MPDVPKSTLTDLNRFSEALRRSLYDRVAEILFPPRSHTPDDARLQILYIAGRWLATWVNLDEAPTRPEHQRFHLARIGASSENPADIALYDI